MAKRIRSARPIDTFDQAAADALTGRGYKVEAAIAQAALLAQTSGGKAFTKDTFQNFLTQTGIGTANLSSGNTYGFNPISRNRTLIEWMYRGAWLCGVAVDCVADDMTREGIQLSTAMDPDDKEKLESAQRRMQIWQSLNMVAKWARLYGGALGYIYIDGQKPESPLRIETIKPGQFKGIIPLDMWMTTPSLNEGITDPGPEYGNPKYYTVTATSPQFPFPRTKVHYSRVIRMLGIELPYWQRTMENMWGISIMERIYDRLTAFDSTTQGAAQLAYRAYLRTYKIKNLRSIIAAGGPAYQALLEQINMTRLFQSNEGLTLMDGEDEFEAHQYSFSGLDGIMDKMAEQISGATQIPLARLFGQSPSGLNTTGDHDLRTYYDNIKRQQERWFRRPLDVTVRVLAKSEDVELPEGFEYEFASLWQMTDDEKATVDAGDTNSVSSIYSTGMISVAGALKELRARGRSTGRWSTITDKDIKEAEKQEFVPGVSQLMQGSENGAEEGEEEPGMASGTKPKAAKGGPSKPSATAKKPTAKANKPTAKKPSADRARMYDLQGLPIQIETAEGEIRKGAGWETVMPADYGFIHGIPSAEGPLEELDCYVGKNMDSDQVFVINQGRYGAEPDVYEFDEHKVMLGFDEAPQAIAAYDKAFSDGHGLDRIMSVVPMTMDQFKGWVASADLGQPCMVEEESVFDATVTPVKFEIEESRRGFEIIVTMSNGERMVWGKDIKTRAGAERRVTEFKRRHGVA